LQAGSDGASVCAAIALIDGDASIMSPLNAAGMASEQELAHLHHPVKPLVISRQRLALDDSVDSSRRLACNERCKGLRKSSSFCKPRSGRMPLG
jgi:hypothetical protein